MGVFDGRHVVVTGASGGLGRAVVAAFRGAGAECHLPYLEPDVPAAAAGVHPTPGIDLTADAAVATYYERLPPLWASVHLAGGFRFGPIADTSLDHLRAQLDINLVTAFLCCREAVRNMRRKDAPGSGRGGRIVNVSSRAALLPAAGLTAYAASKAAVAALTATLAAEVLDEGILVNAVAPSIIDTPANRAAMPKADHARWPAPEEVARAILWLASPENTLTSGVVVPVYGRA